MAAPHDWFSHIWTEQTLMRLIGSSQQQVEIRTSERMPQSFMVPLSLLQHYCPKLRPSPTGQTFVLETSRPVLTLFFGWLYTGKVDSSDWHDLTELYFLGNAVESIALKRSTITQLQKACRNDQGNNTELFHYEHISVIEEMDDVGVNDDPSNYPKSSLFFMRLFQRSFREQKEPDDCLCCHDYCRYHDHESEAERLATCGASSLISNPSDPAPLGVPVNAPVNVPVRDPSDVVKPESVVRKARKSKGPVRTSLKKALASGIDDDSSYEARTTASRSGTPKGKATGDTWLTVQSRAPADYPAEYHGLLTSLPQVQSIRPSNWLEIGVEAEGVDQLPKPDRIIAAAMSWNAEDYAQTKCTFFNQYDAAITDRQNWLKTLRFGGSKSKEKAERLLAMWESLGWLKSPETITNNRLQHPNALEPASEPPGMTNSETTRPRISFGAKWSEEEKNAVAQIMKSINADESCARLSVKQRVRICNKRLESSYGYYRTDRAVEVQWYRTQEELAGATTAETNSQVISDDSFNSEDKDFVEDTGKRPGLWSSQEQEEMLEIMDALERTAAHKDTTINQRAEICRLRLKARFGTDRTPVAIAVRYRILRRSREANQDGDMESAVDDSAIDGTMPILLKTPLTTARDDRTGSAVLNTSESMSKTRWTEQEDKTMIELFKTNRGGS
ncbi:hypothetical protein QM012_008529 [Aureobasidium pullulans]|uniref:BTB domain-containing protein n=1 Tax=Aureobasidium pullulans TaxID=5580 RepID=A0ABR0TJS0_AURPU